MRMAALEKVRYSWCCISIKGWATLKRLFFCITLARFGFCLTSLTAISLHTASGYKGLAAKNCIFWLLSYRFYRLMVHFFNPISLNGKRMWTEVNHCRFSTQCDCFRISGRLLSLVVNGCKPLSTVCTVWQKTSPANSPRQKYVSKICGNLGSDKWQPKSVKF